MQVVIIINFNKTNAPSNLNNKLTIATIFKEEISFEEKEVKDDAKL